MSKIIIKNRYATIPNELLNREDISLKAKGLYAYFQSKPDNWKFSKERLSKNLKEGIDSIKSAFKELKDAGYLETKPVRNKGTFTGYDYILNTTALVDLPQGGKPALRETRTAVKPTAISKKDSSKKDSSKKDNIILHSDFEKSHYEVNNIIKLFEKININYQSFFNNKTQRKAIEDLLTKFGYEKLIGTMEYIVSISADKYAPVITSPLELKNKLAKLIVYYKKNNSQLTPVF
jgi:hypothetical protein